jgi:hypothetical protein
MHRAGKFIALDLTAVFVHERRVLMGTDIQESAYVIPNSYNRDFVVFEFTRDAFAFSDIGKGHDFYEIIQRGNSTYIRNAFQLTPILGAWLSNHIIGACSS